MPAAALRALRTAAGRHALRAALVVVGLFALGFLCGERAYAADGVPVGTGASTSSVSVPSAPGGVVPSMSEGDLSEGDLSEGDPAASEPVPPAPRRPDPHDGEPTAPAGSTDDAQGTHSADSTPGADVTDDLHHPLRPATDHLVQGVADRVVAPVGDLVGSVTEGLAQTPPLESLPVLPSAPEAPSWPSLPGFDMPGMPDVPGMPGVPGFPGLPSLPATPAVPGQTLPAPVTTTPQPESKAPASGDGHGAEGRPGTAAPVTYGPWAGAGAAVPDVSMSGDAHRTAPFGYAPVHQAPADHPGGAGGSRSAGDNNTPRHGDAQAVSLSRRPPLRLLPGAAARAEADEIRDRHGDIPVSPA